MLATNSHPITFNPCSNPAIKVVPLPAKGSNIVYPTFYDILKQNLGMSIGNFAGCVILLFSVLP